MARPQPGASAIAFRQKLMRANQTHSLTIHKLNLASPGNSILLRGTKAHHTMIISDRLQRMYLLCALLCIMLIGGEAKAQKLSYVDFRMSGPIVNGDTRIEEDGDYTTLDVRATIVPEMATSPELIQLVYSDDASQKVFSANLTMVPQTAPYSVEKGSPYVLSIYDGANRYSMSTSLISMHITKLTLGKTYAFGSLGIKEIEANFTGKVLYRDLNQPNAEEIEHLIDGSLYYQGRI